MAEQEEDGDEEDNEYQDQPFTVPVGSITGTRSIIAQASAAVMMNRLRPIVPVGHPGGPEQAMANHLSNTAD